MSKSNKNVLVGSDGWLFLFQGGQSQFDFLTGKKTPSDESIQNFHKNIKTRVTYFQNKNIPYKHIIFPSKPLLKKFYLPLQYKKAIRSVYERNYENQIDDSPKNSIFYPLNNLKLVEQEHSTFKKYDTHMTDRSYLFIATYLLKFFNISISDFPIFFNKKEVTGDLGYMIQSNNKNLEEFIFLDDQYTYHIGNRNYLPSNTNEVYLTHSYHEKAKNRLLIFGDSFFKDVIKYLSPFFKDILYIRSSTIQYDIVELYKPDIVFTGNAERYLSKVQSDTNTTPFLFELYGSQQYSPSSEYLSAFKANLSFRYYPKIYQQWDHQCKELTVPSLKLNNYLLNNDIQPIKTNSYLKLNSIGRDPNITYNNVSFEAGCEYSLDITLISSINSIFQVFYTDSRDRPLSFDENLSIRKPVKIGHNHFIINLTFPFLGEALRIDPLNSVGAVEIIKIKLSELNEHV